MWSNAAYMRYATVNYIGWVDIACTAQKFASIYTFMSYPLDHYGWLDSALFGCDAVTGICPDCCPDWAQLDCAGVFARLQVTQCAAWRARTTSKPSLVQRGFAVIQMQIGSGNDVRLVWAILVAYVCMCYLLCCCFFFVMIDMDSYAGRI